MPKTHIMNLTNLSRDLGIVHFLYIATNVIPKAEVTPQLLRHLYVYRPSIMRRKIICLY